MILRPIHTQNIWNWGFDLKLCFLPLPCLSTLYNVLNVCWWNCHELEVASVFTTFSFCCSPELLTFKLWLVKGEFIGPSTDKNLSPQMSANASLSLLCVLSHKIYLYFQRWCKRITLANVYQMYFDCYCTEQVK